MADTEDVFSDKMALSTRSSKLSQLVLGKTSKKQVAHQSIASQEGLLDALFLLHDECKNEKLRKNKYVKEFIDKATPVVNELENLRICIDDFEVRKTIGRGHFGEVQLVRERVTENVYAMKTLRKSETLSQSHVAFFEEERNIMSKAVSPWLTQLQYAFQDKMNLYLVMEYHPGGDLLSLLARFDDVFTENMARFYLAEITLALHALHSMGYLHQDIKPDNLCIDRTGHLKLADFGSATKIQQKIDFKMPNGTPDYVSPELLMSVMNNDSESGNRRRNETESKMTYGPEVDWWSMGIVAYEFMFGTTPFTDEDGNVAVTYSNCCDITTWRRHREVTHAKQQAEQIFQG